MKKALLSIFILSSLLLHSQNEKVLLNESFTNNSNNWEVSTKKDWSSSINNGNYILSNNKTNYVSYFKPNNLFLNNKQNYEIEANIKFSISENNSSSGLILIYDEQHKEDGLMLTGYLIMITKSSDEYYLHLNKSDGSNINYLEKLNDFNINKTHNIRIKINNNTPVIKVFINNELIFENYIPLFNFHNVGFYQNGKVSTIVNDIKVKASIENNNKFTFDVTDMVWNNSLKSLEILRGSQYFTELTGYVPEALLFDDYNYQFNKFKEKLLIDDNCSNFQTLPLEDGTYDAFILKYRSNRIFTLVSKDNTFIATSVTFSDPNKAFEFYNLYSKAKAFKIESNRAYLPSNPMKAIMLNKEENSVQIFY